MMRTPHLGLNAPHPKPRPGDGVSHWHFRWAEVDCDLI
jgi:hypothetical protein